MEHEVHVPFPVGSVRAALAEAERGLRCVPGLTWEPVDGSSLSGTAVGGASGDVGALDEVAVRGRLRVRIGGSTITYRGTLRLSAERQGFAIEADGTEARGDGSAQLLLTVVPRTAPDDGPAAEGDDTALDSATVLAFSGTVSGRGRLVEFEEKQLKAAGRRLLDRFATALADSLAADPPADHNDPAIPGIPAPESQAATGAGAAPADDASDHTTDDGGVEDVAGPTAVQDEKSGLSVFETEIPPPSLDPEADDDAETDDDVETDDDTDDHADTDADGAQLVGDDGSEGEARADLSAQAEIPAPGAPPAEAAHARRTMIGRSAEEVDHAPPRGRYAPVPPPEPTSSGATLRWAAPAAALAVASVVVISRVVRRRRS